ncbi:uncharacterized protein LOC112511312 [Cynara cardunculus var. scolymus]|uniref:uncharacterized protein LOC112511312 n=1 Tax=Cynara cardunculus var. scolymus TaxID=59895 RepID=UPI000D62CFB6|nr:uncharacterized protein LOC112511312 [Cynara cardunculus var. scolymus]
MMVLDSVINSPHRRSQTAFSSPSFRKQSELGSFSTIIRRHQFLLTALALLAFLCTVYLYFAVTLGEDNSCSGLTVTQKALCHAQHVKQTVAKGKMKIL